MHGIIIPALCRETSQIFQNIIDNNKIIELYFNRTLNSKYFIQIVVSMSLK